MAEHQRTCFGPEELEDFLHERTDERQEAAIVAHLDACDACQRQLEQVAAEQGVWNQVKQQFQGQGGWSTGAFEDAGSNAYAMVEGGGKVVVVTEAMASLFLGTKDGERLSGTPRNYFETSYWGKDSVRFNTELLTWLLR